MSRTRRFSLAPHSALLNGLFATAACAIALTVTAGPALAQSQGLARVEVAGKPDSAPVRTDVRASCFGIDGELQRSLSTAWWRERLPGEVKVSFTLNGDKIEAVRARSVTRSYELATRRAVRELRCSDPQGSASRQDYSFRVVFIDPYSPDANRSTASVPGYSVAVLSD
jgi:hypothetical protein